MLIPHEYNTLEKAVGYVLMSGHSDPCAVLLPTYKGRYGINGIQAEIDRQTEASGIICSGTRTGRIYPTKPHVEELMRGIPEGICRIDRVQDSLICTPLPDLLEAVEDALPYIENECEALYRVSKDGATEKEEYLTASNILEKIQQEVKKAKG